MRMWSRGLGTQNLGINLSKINIMTLSEALNFMVNEAEKPLLREIGSRKVVALSGKMLPPTGWEFVITLEFKEIFVVAWKLFSWKTIKSFFLNPAREFFVRFTESPIRNKDT